MQCHSNSSNATNTKLNTTTYMVSTSTVQQFVNMYEQFCIYVGIWFITNSRLIVLLLVSNILLAHYHRFWNGFYGLVSWCYFTTKTLYLKLKIYTTRVEFQISWNIWHKWELLRFKWKLSQISINSPDVHTEIEIKTPRRRGNLKYKYWDYLKVSVCN